LSEQTVFGKNISKEVLTVKLTQEEVIERWQVFWTYAQRVQELKDLTLDLKTVGTEEQLKLNEQKLKEIIEEISYTYQECMIPIIKDIAGHIEANGELIQDILEQGNTEDIDKTFDEIDKLLAAPREMSKASDISGIRDMIAGFIDKDKENKQAVKYECEEDDFEILC
jgi:hypothetical protein